MTSARHRLAVTPRVLWQSGLIRDAIRDLFDDAHAERIAVVAFVGEGASAYIPKPKGLTLICWDKEGCTSPDEIRELRALGVRVLFARSVHAKLFWAAGRGTLIGSANLSRGALGDGGLFETMVALPDTAVDIHALVECLAAREVTAAMLDDLDQRTAAFRSRNRGQLVFEGRAVKRQNTFGDWFAQPLTNRPRWTLFAFNERINRMAKKAEAQMQAAGVEEAFDYWCGMPYHAIPGRWMLSVDVDHVAKEIHWAQCEESPIRLATSDRGLYGPFSSMFATQYHRPEIYGRRPFNCSEKAFVLALKELLQMHGVTNYKRGLKLLDVRTGELSAKALEELANLYRNSTRSIQPPRSRNRGRNGK